MLEHDLVRSTFNNVVGYYVEKISTDTEWMVYKSYVRSELCRAAKYSS